MKLGDGVEQAIHSVTMLSCLQPGSTLSAAALAEFHGVSTSYLLKHLQAMSGAGLLEAVPGPKAATACTRAREDHPARYRPRGGGAGAGLSLQRNPPSRPQSLFLQAGRAVHDQCRDAQGRAGLSRRTPARDHRRHHGRPESYRPRRAIAARTNGFLALHERKSGNAA